MLTSILELGAWVGTLANGYLADAVGRRVTVVIAVVIFCVGVIVQACTQNPDFVYAGRFVTGLGVGNLSMIVPLYNAELVLDFPSHFKSLSYLILPRLLPKFAVLWLLFSNLRSPSAS